MEIMQMLQVIPQAVPAPGTAPEVPAGSAATPDHFASLMAGLLVQPPATTASADELPTLAAETMGPNDQNAAAPETDDIDTAELAMMSLASLVAPPTIVPQNATVIGIPDPAVATVEANAAIPATQVTATAPEPAPAMVLATATSAESAALPSQTPQTATVIPQPELLRDTTQAKPPMEAASPASAPQAATQPVPVKNAVEVLSVTLEPAKTAGVPASEPLPETALDVAVAEKPSPRATGLTAAYPDRIPVIPKGEHSPVTAERAPVTETARQTDASPVAGAKAQEVEVIVKGEAGEQQSSGEQGSGGSHTADLKGHAAPVHTDTAKSFEPALTGTTKSEHQPANGLRDSIMAQVKEGIATREPARNGEIAIRLAPAELGELRINVRVVDQQVRVEVVAANSQVREILLNNQDSLKENFSRQNLTMTGFDVSTGTGQGQEQLFREGREAGQQGGFRTAYRRGTAEEETMAVQETGYYYTDRRDSILDVRL
ncbi:flagellar hook-length control protein FliK [Geobacter benzoatilyticus]|uniref:Flagellar hook-length control protein FliK n=1 Tax=Geobacter benzoatilyticus TaxID=2815309 RepID=A0ABX7Q4F8_9BACT|nr:flagellar hook-length control protein FliK [Geobacter benzoatilyticus]QSV46348.1 flagellar hook-length control protein FliK [Geobacter benzoatilyticus]